MAFADFAGGIKICHMYAQVEVSVALAVTVAVPARESRDIAYIIFGHDRHLSNSRFWQCQRLFDYVEAFALFSKNSFYIYFLHFLFLFLHFVFILFAFCFCFGPLWVKASSLVALSASSSSFFMWQLSLASFCAVIYLKVAFEQAQGQGGGGYSHNCELSAFYIDILRIFNDFSFRRTK